MYEIREYFVTRSDKGSNSRGLFTEDGNTFLKLKKSGYTSVVHSKDGKDKYIDDYRRAEGISLYNTSIFKNTGQTTLAKLKSNSMWGKWEQN